MTNQLQKEISIFRQVRQPVDLPIKTVAKQPTFNRAIRLCMDESTIRHRSNQDWADLLGCSKGYVNQVYNGTGSRTGNKLCFNLDQLHTLQVEAGNWAVYQWLELRKHGQLDIQSDNNRKQRLLDELAEINSREAQT